VHTATITEAKNQLSALIDRVKSGESVLILDRGIPVARLDSAVTAGDDEGKLARLERAGLVTRPRNPGAAKEVLSRQPTPLPDGVSAVEMLLEERRSGR